MQVIDIACDNGRSRQEAITLYSKGLKEACAKVVEGSYLALARMEIKVDPSTLKIDKKLMCVVGKAEVVRENLPVDVAAFAKEMGYPAPTAGA